MILDLPSMALRAALALGLAASSLSAHSGEPLREHGHEHSIRQPANVSVPTGKWATDHVLRGSMDNIRRVLFASRADIDRERLAAADYQRLAGIVDSNIANILQNCRLPKDADAAFHETVMKDLIWASEMMRTAPKTQARRAGALAAIQALRNYGEYFQHPGWAVASGKEG